MPTVGTLTYRLVAKGDEFKQGLEGSSRALRDQRRLFLATRTPVEQHRTAVEQLTHLYRTGKLSQDVYTRSLSKLKAEYRESRFAALGLGSQFSKLASLSNPVTAGLAAVGFATASLAISARTLNSVIAKTADRFGELDTIAKASAALNLTEGSLIGLRMAASEFSGVDAPQVDKALQRMTRNIGEAARGIGESREAFQTLGLDARQLGALNADEAFLRIADAVAQVPNPVERTRLAFELLGRGGADLVTTLSQGSAELQAMIETSAILSQSEFINFSAIEAANDSVARLQMLFDGLFNVLASEFAPLVTVLSDSLVDGFVDSSEAGEKFRGIAFQVALAAATLADLVRMAAQEIQEQVEWIKWWYNVLSKMVPILWAVNYALEGFAGATEQAIADQESFTSQFLRMRAEMMAATREAPEQAILGPDIEAAEKLKDQLKEIDRERERQHKEEQRRIDGLRKRGEAIEKSLRTPVEKLQDDIAEVQMLWQQGFLDPQTMQRAFAQFTDTAADIITKSRGAGADFGNEARRIGAIEAGSQEALRFAAQFGQKKPVEETAKNTKEMATTMVRALASLKIIEENTSGGGDLLDAEAA